MSLPLAASQVADSPAHNHGSRRRVGILLVNLGTPEAPTGAALRPYLKEFLSDPRVVEIPKLAWWPILNLIILNTRPRKSAAKYASIWMPEGSPLRVYTDRQKAMLEDRLREAGMDPIVRVAMRYGQPTIAHTIQAMAADGVDKLCVIPLYAQYSAATTATIFDRVFDTLARMRNPPALRLRRNFHDHPAYIDAVANSISAHWAQHGQGQKLLFSFHGVPKRSLLKGDPYHCECQKTGRLVAERLGLSASQWEVSFQSRFGPAEWLQPYTAKRLEELPHEGVKSLDVVCPGFISDCLETLEEIQMEGKEEFLMAGGERYTVVPCLNDSPAAGDLLAKLVAEETSGWPMALEAPEQAADRARGGERARAMGAS